MRCGSLDGLMPGKSAISKSRMGTNLDPDPEPELNPEPNLEPEPDRPITNSPKPPRLRSFIPQPHQFPLPPLHPLLLLPQPLSTIPSIITIIALVRNSNKPTSSHLKHPIEPTRVAHAAPCRWRFEVGDQGGGGFEGAEAGGAAAGFYAVEGG